MLALSSTTFADFEKKHQGFTIHISDKTIMRNGDIAKYKYTAYDDVTQSFDIILNCKTMKYQSWGDSWYLAVPGTVEREFSEYVCRYKK